MLPKNTAYISRVKSTIMLIRTNEPPSSQYGLPLQYNDEQYNLIQDAGKMWRWE